MHGRNQRLALLTVLVGSLLTFVVGFLLSQHIWSTEKRADIVLDYIVPTAESDALITQTALNRLFPNYGLRFSSGCRITDEVTTNALYELLFARTTPTAELPEDLRALAKSIDQAFENVAEDNKCTTEAERLVKTRVGQNIYRNRQMAYWGNQCAVTGIGIAALLRASHAKPWAACSTGKERLDLFNGFLLTADLDALFDQFLISFSDDGQILISDGIRDEVARLGITADLRLRRIDSRHLPYIAWHCAEFLRRNKQ